MFKERRSARLLLVDDDPVFCQDMSNKLAAFYDLQIALDATAAVQTVSNTDPDLVLLDLDLGAGRPDGLKVLSRLREVPEAPPVIMLTRSADVNTIVATIRAGAFHFCPKPPRLPELRNLIDLGLQNSSLRRQMRLLTSEVHSLKGGFVAEDRKMRAVLGEIERVAPMETTVLITGPCGAGKEVVARRIHALSAHSSGPFVGVNCAAIPDNLIESELFGHERGSFTGATRRHRGAFEQAGSGTLFLDEIGDAPQRLHTKLLRVLEEREFTPVGGEKTSESHARVIAATSKDLEAEVAAGHFREELYFRLNVFRICVPGLDDRPGDVETLAMRFLVHFASDAKKRLSGFTAEALAYLRARKWPGNVRELRNVVERGVIRCDGDQISLGDLTYGAGFLGITPPHYHEARDLVLHKFKKEYLTTQLRNAGGNISRAADLAGVKRQAFSKMLRDEKIDAEEA